MTPNVVGSRSIGKLASATGGVGLIGIVSISLFFIFGGFFGPLNDLFNAVGALLGAGLAWRLYPWQRAQSPRLSRWPPSAAGLGALIAVVGSALVLSRRTGWYLAGLYTTFGYALIGLWLWRLNAAPPPGLAWPRRLVQFGRITGAAMALGLLALPGILRGVDTAEAAPWWANAGYVGSLGWFLLYPVWCLWLGRVLSGQGVTRPEAAPGRPVIKV